MTQQELAKLVEQRMVQWSKQLIEAHSTPFIMIGLGHDHRDRQAVTFLEDKITVPQTIAYLENVVELLKSKV